MLTCFGAWSASAGSISNLQGSQNSQGQNQDGNSSGLILQLSLVGPLGGSGSSNSGSLQAVLDGLKTTRPYFQAPPGFYGGLAGGKPGPIVIVGLPGVNPIPEPRTWLLYVFGALIGVWVVRKELRAS
jgi:hypothetical protein